MASNLQIVRMHCSKCNAGNYVTKRNKVNMQQKGDKTKLVLNKLCPNCKEVTPHNEKEKTK